MMSFKLLLLIGLVIECSSYKIPHVRLDILPQGFRVSIPDESGIKNVAFNINRNRQFKGFEPGEFSKQISTPYNKRWSYENTQKALQRDDIVYIWTNVQHNQLIYRNIEEPIPVELIGNSADNGSPRSTESPLPEINNKDNIENISNGQHEENKCEYSITKTNSEYDICKGQLVFEENFNNGFEPNRWQYEVRVALDVADAEFVLYDNIVENIGFVNSQLTIVPTLWNADRPGTDVKHGALDLGLRCTSRQNLPQECTRHPDGFVYDILPPIRSARINSRESFSFIFGRVDIRARIPKGNWLYPLMLLEPVKNNFGPVLHKLANIRIAFARGNEQLHDENGADIDGKTLYGGIVFYSESFAREQFFVNVRHSDHFGDNFHVYTLIWTDTKLRFQVDGDEYGYIDDGFFQNNSSVFELFAQEFYITLGVAAGGHADFPDGSISYNRTKPWLNTSPKAAYDFWKDRSHWKATWVQPQLQVDYVRVYAV